VAEQALFWEDNVMDGSNAIVRCFTQTAFGSVCAKLMQTRFPCNQTLNIWSLLHINVRQLLGCPQFCHWVYKIMQVDVPILDSDLDQGAHLHNQH
jgi:hypothetical protein